MSKKKNSGKVHTIKEELLVKAELIVNVNLSELDCALDFNSLKSIKNNIIKQLDFCLRNSYGLDPVAYSIDILENKSKSVLKYESTIKDDDS